MSDTFRLKGSFTVIPAPCATDSSGDFDIRSEVLEQLAIKAKVALTVSLDADPAEAVNFSDLAGAHVVVIKSSAKVVATLTSADGAAQTIPVDTFAVLTSSSVPFTALSLTRVTSIVTTAKVLLCEKA